MALTVVTGGVRSGKSRWAEDRARELGGDAVLYLATAEAGDPEMERRIERHRSRRPEAWTTVEAPFDPAAVLREAGAAHRAVLIDCATLWLSNLMTGGADARAPVEDAELEARMEELVASLTAVELPVVLVTNEVGLGGIGSSPLERRFADALGRLNVALAAAADEVVLMISGRPLLVPPAAPR